MVSDGRQDDRTRQGLGTRIAGRYEIERELGRGGMATVYLARDLKHGRPVAIKFLSQPRPDTTSVERFAREIQTLARLSHPHILALYDSGDTEGVLYFVTPYVAGESLRVRLERDGRLEIAEVTRLGIEVADALAFAHTRGVIHRDIKPENLLLADGHVLVADFGIARAILLGSGGRLTESGTFVGTPAYMSPEQATGDIVDGRSDVYSLGCVLYEALAGAPPYTAPSARALLARRLVTLPTPLRRQRREVSPALERAVMRAIQPYPDDRFAKATEFRDALEAARARAGGGDRRRLRRAPVLGAVLVAVMVLGIAAGKFYLTHARTAAAKRALDPSRYAVFPFLHRDGSAPPLLAGDNCQRLIGDALARWQGVTQVSELVLHEALATRDTSFRTALQVAAGQGAGQLIWGQVGTGVRKDVVVRATLYDVATGEVNASAAVAVAPDLGDAAQQFTVLADSLIAHRTHGTLVDAESADTHSLPALEAYVAGYRALAAWDLATAEGRFREATRIDPTFAQAQLWLAQTMAWAYAVPPPDWPGIAARAAALRDGLGPRDRHLGEALGDLANGRYADACAHYAGLVRGDSLDFIAWYGLGECQSRDHRVVADERSPSGWRYRTSLHSATGAYLRALRIIPSFQQAFVSFGSTRLARLLFAEPGNYRDGYAIGGRGDSVLFAAFPALDHDTLAFVPHPLADLLAGNPETQPATQPQAILRNIGLLRNISAQWVRAAPASSSAHLQLGRVLESMGALESSGAGDTSAVTEARRARALGTSADDRLAAMTDEVRYELKSFRFADARALADTVAGTWTAARHSTPAEARTLAALAGLTGHIGEAVHRARLAAPLDTLTMPAEGVVPPRPVAEAAAAFSVYAAFGAPIDSVSASEDRLERLVRTWVEPRQRADVLQAVLAWPSGMAYPELGPVFLRRAYRRGDRVAQLQWAATHGDTAGLRSRLAPTEQPQYPFAGGTLDLRGLFELVQLWLVVGDTARATRAADTFLPTLPRFGQNMLDDVGQPAALVRTMALRAELADRAGDRATARRWAQSVVDLWSDADPPLGPLVARMRVLASPS